MRVVVLGPGGAGKTTFARRLAARTGAELVEIDNVFWQPGLVPLSLAEWERRQVDIFAGDHWVADGDLGPYDALDVRLRRADAVVLFDVPLWRCVWRSWRRSRQRLDYWQWMLTWHRRSRPGLLTAIARHPQARLRIVRRATDITTVLDGLTASG
jgi:adenylate kinase family enzyme